jgi:hypothetical protein
VATGEFVRFMIQIQNPYVRDVVTTANKLEFYIPVQVYHFSGGLKIAYNFIKEGIYLKDYDAATQYAINVYDFTLSSVFTSARVR